MDAQSIVVDIVKLASIEKLTGLFGIRKQFDWSLQMVLVYMAVYNEEASLTKTIESVLGQTHTEFKLLISDNHSTDSSSSIIKSAASKDTRVIHIKTPYHMASAIHAQFLFTEVLSKLDFKYSIFLGGHDLWSRNVLSVLVSRAEAETDLAAVYTECYEIDSNDTLIKRYDGLVQIAETPRQVIPHHVLLGLTHNTVNGGLWVEACRKKIAIRYPCVGLDHFLVAELALQGRVLFQPGAIVYLRRSPTYDEGGKGYIKRHIPLGQHHSTIEDFVMQLEWASYLAERAAEGNPMFANLVMLDLLKTSLISSYICRYWTNLLLFEQGVERFFSDPDVRTYLTYHSSMISTVEPLFAQARNNYKLTNAVG